MTNRDVKIGALCGLLCFVAGYGLKEYTTIKPKVPTGVTPHSEITVAVVGNAPDGTSVDINADGTWKGIFTFATTEQAREGRWKAMNALTAYQDSILKEK